MNAMSHRSFSVTPTATEHHHHGGGTPAATKRVSGAGIDLPGNRLRDLVAKLLKERERTLRFGWARSNPAAMRDLMRPLHQWVLSHPSFVSVHTARAFHDVHGTALRLVAPANPAGRKILQELNELVTIL